MVPLKRVFRDSIEKEMGTTISGLRVTGFVFSKIKVTCRGSLYQEMHVGVYIGDPLVESAI